MLPVQYLIEFQDYYASIYNEETFEYNEVLAVKKVIFLLVALAMEDGLKDYKELKDLLELWKAKKLTLPKRPIQYEILKYALHLV